MFPPLPAQQTKFLNPTHVLAQLGLAPGMQVADFGCGSGDWVLVASRLVGTDGKVAAIDVQDSALSSVRSRSRIEGALNVSSIRADLETPRASGLPNASLDAVFLSNILFQSSKKERILHEAFRVLKPKGLLLFADWKEDAPLGPARELRLEKSAAAKLIEGEGFSHARDIEAGAYHIGMVFTKVQS